MSTRTSDVVGSFVGQKDPLATRPLRGRFVAFEILAPQHRVKRKARLSFALLRAVFPRLGGGVQLALRPRQVSSVWLPVCDCALIAEPSFSIYLAQ